MKHDSVLLTKAIDYLQVNPDGDYLDCTGGLGGHSVELLSRLSKKARVWICDYHRETTERLTKKFEDDNRVKVILSRFSRIFDNLVFPFDGILADFGVSSPQLDDSDLGIGFMMDGVFLDMRLDKTLTETASDILKTKTEKELADIFYFYGGETASRKIARAIFSDRKQKKYYTTTNELRDLCARVLGRFYRGKKIHAATKVFQALRIVVNKELDEVKLLLDLAPAHLKKNGRFVTIAFHSGEDSLVKAKFRDLSKTEEFCLPVKKATKPERKEVLENPRSRSARLRVLEKV